MIIGLHLGRVFNRFFRNVNLSDAVNRVGKLGFGAVSFWNNLGLQSQGELNRISEVVQRFDLEVHLHLGITEIAEEAEKRHKPFMEVFEERIGKIIDWTEETGKGKVVSFDAMIKTVGGESSIEWESRNGRWLMVHKIFDDINLETTYEVLRYTADRVSHLGMKVAIENIWPETTLPEELLRMRREVNREAVGLLLDVGHLKLSLNWPWMCGRYRSISEYIKAIPLEIVEIHLHNNDGKNDQHLPLDKGKIDVSALVKTLLDMDYDRSIILENVPRSNRWEEETLKSKEIVEKFINMHI